MRNICWIAALALMTLPASARAQSLRPRADAAWQRGDRAAARTLYLECIQVDTADATALFRLGLMDTWDGRHQQSIAWFDRVLAMHPEDRDARVARARAVAAAGNLDSAMATVDSILRAFPDETGALVAGARFAEWKRDLTSAERLWRRALDVDPDHAGARAGLAGTLRRQGRTIEARREIAIALAAAPHDADVLAASDHIERLFRPRLRSAVIVEDDSDGNAITSVVAGASVRLAGRFDLNADAWTRSAGLDVAAVDVVANGATIGVVLDSPSGWTFGAAVGASGSNDPAAATVGALAAHATSPADRVAILTFNGSRTPLDHTLPLVRNRVVLTEGSVSLDARSGRDWDFNAFAALATFDVRASGENSRRISGRASARRRLDDRFALTFGAHVFGFDRNIDGGFFDPDAYGLLDAALSWRHEPDGWLLNAEVGPGIQRIGTAGSATGAVRATASIAWQTRPGRQFTLRGTFANTDVQQLGDAHGGTYRYASISIGFAWWF